MAGFFSKLFGGTPEKREFKSTLTDQQQGLHNQLTNSLQNRGAGGAYGDTADYYRDLLSNDSADYNAFSAPALRQYNQDIVPGISEQFAQMGAGGLSSSGFRNAQIQGATDLSERLGALRANLRQSGAQGLQNLGAQGLNPITQNVVTQQGSEGLLSQAAPIIGTALGSFGGPLGAAAGGSIGNWFKNSMRPGTSEGGPGFGGSSPYGGGSPQASPNIGRQPLPSLQYPNRFGIG